MKMYILVRDDIPLGFALVAAAHASLACYLQFQDLSSTKQWLNRSFRKVVCKVSPEEFEKAKEIKQLEKVVLTESSLEGAETAIAFAPMEKWPHFFHTLKLYKD